MPSKSWHQFSFQERFFWGKRCWKNPTLQTFTFWTYFYTFLIFSFSSSRSWRYSKRLCSRYNQPCSCRHLSRSNKYELVACFNKKSFYRRPLELFFTIIIIRISWMKSKWVENWVATISEKYCSTTAGASFHHRKKTRPFFTRTRARHRGALTLSFHIINLVLLNLFSKFFKKSVVRWLIEKYK